MKNLWGLWRRRRQKRDRLRAQDDRTSLGNMLLKSGMIEAGQLKEALDFQDQNPDVMLGEALINLGVVDRGIIEALLVAQEATRDNRHAAEIINFAARHTQEHVHQAHDRLTALVVELNGKVSKVKA